MRELLEIGRVAAYLRHAWLVRLLYGHDRELEYQATLAHMRFVDLVYGPRQGAPSS